MRRRTAGRLCALALSLGLLWTRAGALFADVPQGCWYERSVAEVYRRGLMRGDGFGCFLPDGVVTRGMVATTLWRLCGSPEPQGAAAFSDVAPEDYYASAAAWGSEQKLISGRGDGTFGGDVPVTRQELAVFLLRYAQYRGDEIAKGVLTIYRDPDAVADWAVDGMRHAVGSGLMSGNEKGCLDPKGTTTRAQLAVVLDRMDTQVVG